MTSYVLLVREDESKQIVLLVNKTSLLIFCKNSIEKGVQGAKVVEWQGRQLDVVWWWCLLKKLKVALGILPVCSG